MPETIRGIVDGFLCTQCGTCVAVCPARAIAMRETPAGLLLPEIINERCSACGKCRKLCPGAEVVLDLPPHVDPFKGEIHGAYIGHASDEATRAGGQSGGVVSALLLFLLETGQIDSALVTTMPDDGSLRPKAVLARTGGEVLAAQGSKYCPVAPNAMLCEVPAGERAAVVGVSCQMHGMHRLAQSANPLARNIRFKIGLFCDRTLLYSSIDQMARNAGLSTREIRGIDFSHKALTGKMRFRLRAATCVQRDYSRIVGEIKDCFTPPRCRLCFDKMNVFSDVSVGDSWGVPGVSGPCSAVIARNEKGRVLLEEAVKQGCLVLKDTDAELMFNGQGVEERRRKFVAFMDAARALNAAVPDYMGIAPRFLTAVESSFRRTCARRFVFNRRVAASRSAGSVLALVRRRLFLSRIQSAAARPVKRLWQKSRSFLRFPKDH